MSYKTAYKQYVEFCGKSFIELLDEAYQDEEKKHHTTDYNYEQDSTVG